MRTYKSSAVRFDALMYGIELAYLAGKKYSKARTDLMKYIPKRVLRYDTNFEDDVLSVEWKESELENDDLKNYKAKAEFYIRQHRTILQLQN